MRNIPFYKMPNLDKEAEEVAKVIRSGWVTFGPKTAEFEEKFAKYIGAPYCVMVDNCTAALYLTCEHVFSRIPKEERNKVTIGIPSLTCAATAIAPIHAGLTVKFIDIEEGDSFCMDWRKTDASWQIPVHYAGKECDTGNRLVAVEDSAHRIIRNGYKNHRQAYSFYATKNLTTSEGGMIACSNEEEAIWYKKARLYGNGNASFSRDKMYSSGGEKYWEFESEFVGWKCNPTDILATIGLVQLEKLDELNAERERVAKRYNEGLGLTTDRSPWHIYPILVPERDKFMYYMKDNGVKCSVHFPLLHRMKAFSHLSANVPLTEKIYDKIVTLPLYPYMENEDIDYVIDLVNKWKKRHLD